MPMPLHAPRTMQTAPKYECSALKTACAWQVCLAFESTDVGQHMLGWATKFCLFPDDEVYIVHCLSKV